MATFSSTPRPAFIYSSSDDTWYEISAKADTASGYEWAGDHTFLSTVLAKYGINNFLNPAERDIEIAEPQRGMFCIIRQDALGNNINELQVYNGTSWNNVLPSQTGNNGKFLQTNGIIASWQELVEPIPQIFMMMGG